MDFVSRIEVMCFAASYAIATLLEFARVVWSGGSSPLRWFATAFGLAGTVAHTLFLIHAGFRQEALPIRTQFESLIVVSWLVGLVYVYLLLRDRRLAAGVFLMPVCLGIVVFASNLSERGFRPTEGRNEILLSSHGMLLLVGTVVAVLAMVVAVMYLVKSRQLRTGSLSGAVRLPSLEKLDRWNIVLVYVAWPLLSLGIALGFALRTLGWGDPKVVATLLAWVLFTVLAHYRFSPEHRGRKVAILTIAAGAAVLASAMLDPLFGTGHQSAPGGWG